MPWWLTLLLFVALFAASYFLVGRPKTDESAADQTANEAKLPRNRLGMAIHSVFGRAQVSGIFIDLVKESFVEHQRSQGGESKKGGKAEYVYYVYEQIARVAFSLGPINRYTKILCDNTTKDINVSSNQFLAGEDVGQCDQGKRGQYIWGYWYLGTPDQTRLSGDTALHDVSDLLDYKYVAYATLSICLGVSPTPLHPRVELERWVKPLSSCPDIINEDANPVQILYHILTDSFHFGLSPLQLDTASFEEASATLVSEGVGCSYVIESTSDLSSCVSEILDWIGGKLYWKNNKLHLKLLRHEDPAVTLDDSDLFDISLESPTWSQVHCAASLEWINPKRDYETDWIYLVDHGAEEMMGTFRMREFSYRIIASPSTAKKVLARKLNELVYPRATVKFTTSVTLDPFSVVRIESGQMGMTGAFRVTSVTKRGRVYEVEGLEEVEVEPLDATDIPSATGGTIIIDFESNWVSWGYGENPIRGLFAWCSRTSDNPYLSTIRVTYKLGTQDLQTVVVPHRCLGTLSHALSADAYTVDREAVIDVDPGFATYAISGEDDVGWFGGGKLLLIGNEFVSVRDVYVDESGYHFTGVIRGFLGTQKSDHTAGTQVILFPTLSEFISLPAQYAGQELVIEMTPAHYFFGQFFLDTNHAETETFTYKGYPNLPLPVSNIQINNQGNDTHLDVGDDAVISWRIQSRKGGAGFQAPGATKPGDGETEYSSITLEIYTVGGTTPVRTETLAADATTYTYTYADQVDDGVGSSDFVVKITPTSLIGTCEPRSITVRR